MPVRDTAPQKSGPPRSPESSCLVPEGLPPSWISPRRLRYIALHPLLLETAPPPFCLSSRRAAFAVLRPQPRSAPALSLRRPAAQHHLLHPRCLPQTRRKSFWGMGGSLRGEGPFELWPKGPSPRNKIPGSLPAALLLAMQPAGQPFGGLHGAGAGAGEQMLVHQQHAP